VIIDLEHFITEERPCWDELETLLDRMAADPLAKQSLDEIKRFHYLYQRTSSALARLQGLAREPEIKAYLDALVARAFGEIHQEKKQQRLHPLRWFMRDFPRTFRRHFGAFRITLLVTLIGCLFGAAALVIDPGSKEVLLPFEHLHGSPSERVAHEERQVSSPLDEHKSTFASSLMTHNTRVSIFAMALGVTWGIGTLILVFYNGVILGAVCFDYLRAGEGEFLLGWLLPHGVVEIPAILIAAQAGLVLAQTLLDRRSGLPLGLRLRRRAADLMTLIGGVAVLLVFAGLIEGFVSQYHQPVIPYGLKIGFGLLELAALILFLSRGGTATTLIADASEGEE
jgi:uncharacterized membrane protein SpoIIM required for sporulation